MSIVHINMYSCAKVRKQTQTMNKNMKDACVELP